MRGRFLIGIAVGVVLGAGVAIAGDWPQFRGPGGTGIAAEGLLPLEWSADKNLAWKVKSPGPGWSSPVVAGDKIFLTAAFSEKEPAMPRGGGFGGPGGGRGGFGGPPQPGQILPPFLLDRLNLTAEQK